MTSTPHVDNTAGAAKLRIADRLEEDKGLFLKICRVSAACSAAAFGIANSDDIPELDACVYLKC